MKSISIIFDGAKLADIQRFIDRVSHLIFWPTLVLFIFIIFFGQDIVHLFGHQFAHTHGLLYILALGQLFVGFGGISTQVLNMTGYQKFSALVYICALIFSAVLSSILVVTLGLDGAAISIIVTQLLIRLAMCLYIRKKLQVNMFAYVGL